MCRAWLVVFGLLCVTPAAALAEDPPLAQELIQRAIEAHGGRAALASYPDLEMKGTQEFFGRWAGRRVDLVHRERGDGAYRTEVEIDFRGRKITPTEFYDGEVRKRRWSRSWDDLPLVEAREEQSHRLPMLLALDLEQATVTDGGVEDELEVWQLSIPDSRDEARLYLAKDDGHLVMLEYPGTSADGMGNTEEVQRRLIYRDLRPVGDLVLPFDIEIQEDGTPQGRARYETVEILEEFDPVWLRVPDPTRRFIPPEELVF